MMSLSGGIDLCEDDHIHHAATAAAILGLGSVVETDTVFLVQCSVTSILPPMVVLQSCIGPLILVCLVAWRSIQKNRTTVAMLD